MVMVGDPIGDFITRLKNASKVQKEEISIPFSSMKYAVAKKLVEHGFLKEAGKDEKKGKRSLDVSLAYSSHGTSKIRDVKRISKPGRRLYTPADGIMPVKHGRGLLILSTPKGILTGDEARKANVGGEMLFTIW